MASYVCTMPPPRMAVLIIPPIYADHDHYHETTTEPPLVALPNLTNLSNFSNRSNWSRYRLAVVNASNATSSTSTTSTTSSTTTTTTTSTTTTPLPIPLDTSKMCSDPTWDHIRSQVLVASVPWAILAIGGLGATSFAPERTANGRNRLSKYQYGLASLGGGPAGAILGVHTLQVVSFILRAISWSVDPIYFALELIGTLFVVIDVSVKWAYRITLGRKDVLLTALTGPLFLDALVCTSVAGLATSSDGGQTWFSFSFLAAFRMLSLVRYLESRANGHRALMFYLFLEIVLFATGSACVIMTLEFMGSPQGGSVQFDEEIIWSVTSSINWVMETVTTLGGASITPKTILGQMFCVVFIPANLFLSGTRVAPLIRNVVLGINFGTGDYDPYKRGSGHRKHIVVVGTSSAGVIWGFLKEVYHLNHYSSIAAFNELCPDVVVMSSSLDTLKYVQKFLALPSALLFRDKVHLMRGDAFNPPDLARSALAVADQVMILPNLTTPDIEDDDNSNIMRMLSIQIACPSVRVTCMLHGAQHDMGTLGLQGTNCSILSLDAFKFSLLAKTCITRGYMAMISNLVTTSGDAPAKPSRWQSEYEESLGCELYEVELSRAYDGAAFIEVVQDVLARSENGDVHLIGFTEKYEGSVERYVRVHPGFDFEFEIDDDCLVSGVFIAPDLGAIEQCPDGEPLVVADTDTNTRARRARAASKVTLFDDDVEMFGFGKRKLMDLAQQRKNEWDSQGRTPDAFMKEKPQVLAFKSYSESVSGVQHRLLVKGMPLDLVSAIVDADEDVEAKAKREAEEAKKKKRRGGLKKRRGFTEAKTGTDLHKLNAINEKVQKQLQRGPPPAPKGELKGHVILTLVSDVTSGGDFIQGETELGGLVGVSYFMRVLRDLRTKLQFELQPTVVILAEEMPGDWYSCVELERVFFVQGSPLFLKDLESAGFKDAATIVVARRHDRGRSGDAKVTDARMILATTLIEANLPREAVAQVVTDHAYSQSCGFLPLGSLPSDELQKLSNALDEKQPPQPSVGNAILSALSGPAQDVDPETLESITVLEDYELMDYCDHTHNPRFMRGNIFVTPFLTSMIGNSVYNPSLISLIGALVDSPMMLIACPSDWTQCRYADLQDWLLAERNVLALGIYRNSGGSADASGITHNYMVTGPPAFKTYMFKSDRILCVAPSAE